MSKKFTAMATAILTTLFLTACGGVGTATSTPATPTPTTTKALTEKSVPSDVAKSLVGDWVVCYDNVGVVGKIKPTTGDWQIEMSPVGFLKYDQEECKGNATAAQPQDSDEQSILDMMANWQAKFETVAKKDDKLSVQGQMNMTVLDWNTGKSQKEKDKAEWLVAYDANTLSVIDIKSRDVLFTYYRLNKK